MLYQWTLTRPSSISDNNDLRFCTSACLAALAFQPKPSSFTLCSAVSRLEMPFQNGILSSRAFSTDCDNFRFGTCPGFSQSFPRCEEAVPPGSSYCGFTSLSLIVRSHTKRHAIIFLVTEGTLFLRLIALQHRFRNKLLITDFCFPEMTLFLAINCLVWRTQRFPHQCIYFQQYTPRRP